MESHLDFIARRYATQIALVRQYADPAPGYVDVAPILGPANAYEACPRGADAALDQVFPDASAEARIVADAYTELARAWEGKVAMTLRDAGTPLPTSLWLPRATLGLPKGPSVRTVAISLRIDFGRRTGVCGFAKGETITAPGFHATIWVDHDYGARGGRRTGDVLVALLAEGEEVAILVPADQQDALPARPRRWNWTGTEIEQAPRTLRDVPPDVTFLRCAGGTAWASDRMDMGGTTSWSAAYRWTGHDGWMTRTRSGSSGYGPHRKGSAEESIGAWVPCSLDTPIEGAKRAREFDSRRTANV